MKMLMEIDPLPMRGLTMVTISPSRRDVSPAQQLRRSPRLVPPRFRLEMAALHPESFILIFFHGKRHLIPKDGHRRTAGWPMRQGARPTPLGAPPTLVDSGWPPSGIFFARYFLLIPKITSVEFQDFWSCAE